MIHHDATAMYTISIYCQRSLPLCFIVEWPESPHPLLLEEGHHFRLALVLRVTRVREHAQIIPPCISRALGHLQQVDIHSA